MPFGADNSLGTGWHFPSQRAAYADGVLELLVNDRAVVPALWPREIPDLQARPPVTVDTAIRSLASARGARRRCGLRVADCAKPWRILPPVGPRRAVTGAAQKAAYAPCSLGPRRRAWSNREATRRCEQPRGLAE